MALCAGLRSDRSRLTTTVDADAQAPGPIVSGAGPGWPTRLSPGDFVLMSTTPGSPSAPAALTATGA